jgi:mRNA interferase MazF
MSENIKRGDIFYISESEFHVGNEQHGGRPAVVISNDLNNKYSGTVEIVYVTTRDKTPLPTHVFLSSIQSTVLCEQITTVSIERIEEKVGECSQEDMEAIEKAILVSLGINTGSCNNKELYERDLYKEICTGLIDRISDFSVSCSAK